MKNIFILLFIICSAKMYAQNEKLSVERIIYREAQWEKEFVSEQRKGKPNEGGLIFVYYRNTTTESQRIVGFNINDCEPGDYTQSGEVAWTRGYGDRIDPQEIKVYEINAISNTFSRNKKFDISITDRSTWRKGKNYSTVLKEDDVRITSMIFQDGLGRFIMHIQNVGSKKWDIADCEFSNKEISNYESTADYIEQNGHIIITGELKEPYKPGDLSIVKVTLKSGKEAFEIFAHRTAYNNYFAIGTWGIDNHRLAEAKYKLHLNTFMKGGNSQDEFFKDLNRKYEFNILTHTGMYPDPKKIDDLKNVHDVAVWYLMDEPDMNKSAQGVLYSNEMLKHLDKSKPTISTFCRNVKFFEMAYIADIACMDHYSVGAPTSSIWPHRYGTRLEETGYYTRDLRIAAFPKPVWVWTQGLFTWDERPQQQVPTPEELGYQLFSNIGNGAKGILWFTIKEKMGLKYPETLQAMYECGRIMEFLAEDLIVSDPLQTEIEGDKDLLIHPLISKNKLVLIVLNQDYSIDPVAYKWNHKQDVDVSIKLTHWFKARTAYELSPSEGVKATSFDIDNQRVRLSIDKLGAYKLFVIERQKVELDIMSNRFEQIKALEQTSEK